MSTLQQDYETQLKRKHDEIDEIRKAGQEVTLQLQIAENDFKSKLENLQETLH